MRDKLNDAIWLAAMAHDGQRDKAGEPYILHPLRVMLAVDPDLRIAAVLHDVVEDTDVSLLKIKGLFGSRVAELVGILTRRPAEYYGDYLQRVGADVDAAIIKLADLRDNLRPPHGESMRERYERAIESLERVLEHE